MPGIILLSVGMLAQPNDAALIAAIEELTEEKVVPHMRKLLPLCEDLNLNLSEEAFKKSFAEILSIHSENMERFDPAWNAHIDFSSDEIQTNLQKAE